MTLFPHPVLLSINLGTKNNHTSHDDEFTRFTKSALHFALYFISFQLTLYVPFINADPKNLALYCVGKRWKGVPN